MITAAARKNMSDAQRRRRRLDGPAPVIQPHPTGIYHTRPYGKEREIVAEVLEILRDPGDPRRPEILSILRPVALELLKEAKKEMMA